MSGFVCEICDACVCINYYVALHSEGAAMAYAYDDLVLPYSSYPVLSSEFALESQPWIPCKRREDSLYPYPISAHINAHPF
jgi:hypothetical protein